MQLRVACVRDLSWVEGGGVFGRLSCVALPAGALSKGTSHKMIRAVTPVLSITRIGLLRGFKNLGKQDEISGLSQNIRIDFFLLQVVTE